MTPSKNRLTETLLPNASSHVEHDRALAPVVLGDRRLCPLPMGDTADMSSHQSIARRGEMFRLSPGNTVGGGDTAASGPLPDTGWESTEAS
jgi:hypothetical protein